MTVKTKKIIGIILFIFPIPLLFLVLATYAILSFILAMWIQSGSADAESLMIIGQVFNIILSTFGIIAVAGIFIGIPVGIILYISARKQEKDKK
jgi:ABC-type Fe3+ transport system permease subunit